MTGSTETTAKAASETTQSNLPPELAQWVGASTGAPRQGPDAVNIPMIRRWYQAMGFAGATGHIERLEAGTVLAPVTMLQVWTHHDRRFDEPEDEVSAVTIFERELEADGFTGVLGTTSVQRYDRPLAVGDAVTLTGRIKSISGLKTTRLGEGRFVTFAYDYTDQSNQSVGLIEMTSLRYRPAGAANTGGAIASAVTEAVAADVPRAAATATRPSWDPRPGSVPPVFAVPVTATLVVTGALATNDFHRVHHDAAYARTNGNADIIMSIMTSLGLVERALWEWLGEGWSITNAALKLGSPCHPADTLSFSATVESASADGSLVVMVRARTARGEHLSTEVGLRRAAG